MKSLQHILEGIFDVDTNTMDDAVAESIIDELLPFPEEVASFDLKNKELTLKFKGLSNKEFRIYADALKKYGIKKFICHHILYFDTSKCRCETLSDMELEVTELQVSHDIYFENCTINVASMWDRDRTWEAFSNCTINGFGKGSLIGLSSLPERICPGSTLNSEILFLNVVDQEKTFGTTPDNIKTLGLFMDSSLRRKYGNTCLNCSSKQFYEDNKHQLSRFNPTKEYGLGPKVKQVSLSARRDPSATYVTFTKTPARNVGYYSFKCSGGWWCFITNNSKE